MCMFTGEDHYSFNQTTATTSAQNSNALGNSARAVGSPESPEENLVNGEGKVIYIYICVFVFFEHTYE